MIGKPPGAVRATLYTVTSCQSNNGSMLVLLSVRLFAFVKADVNTAHWWFEKIDIWIRKKTHSLHEIIMTNSWQENKGKTNQNLISVKLV